jgi:F-type H+-transporting ATPase subunit b
MSLYALLAAAAEGAENHDISKTPSWIWPEGYELAFGGLASVLVFGLLFWKVGPVAKKGMQARTERIQKELDGAANAVASANAEAANIREAKGDIEAERSRLLADADTDAAEVLREGRVRLDAEIAEVEAKGADDLAQMGSRSSEELRGEIARLSADAADRLVADQLDAATHTDLIESFIAKVGASK